MHETHNTPERPSPPQMALGWIIGAVLIFLAQRDLKKRPSEMVRGPIGVWRAFAMTPPGAVAYLVFGRRGSVAAPELDAAPETTTEPNDVMKAAP